jgi:hypothetical protein
MHLQGRTASALSHFPGDKQSSNLLSLDVLRRRKSAVGIVAVYGLGDRGAVVRARQFYEFSLLHVIQTDSETHPAFYPRGTVFIVLRRKTNMVMQNVSGKKLLCNWKKSLLQLNAQILQNSVENSLDGLLNLDRASYGRKFFVFNNVSCTMSSGIVIKLVNNDSDDGASLKLF